MGNESPLRQEDLEYMLQLAVDHYTASRMPQAEGILRGILTITPNEWRAWQLLGSVLAVQGFRVAADAVYRRCLEIKPDDMFALAALAEMALIALRLNDAKGYLERLFALDPQGRHPAANRARRALANALARRQAASSPRR